MDSGGHRNLAQAACRLIIKNHSLLSNLCSRLPKTLLLPLSKESVHENLVSLIGELQDARLDHTMAASRSTRLEKTLEKICSLMLLREGMYSAFECIPT